MKVCPICSKNVGLSTSSLKLHLQKAHKRAICRERGQHHDLGDSEVNLVAPGQPRWEPEPFSEAQQGHDEGITSTDSCCSISDGYNYAVISDDDDANISDLFEEASVFIDHVDHVGGKGLHSCKSLELAKESTPNDGFAKALLALDRKLHGKVSMDWQQKRPEMKVCPICSKNVGLSTSSLKLHLQKAHKQLSAGSVDNAMILEIQKSIQSLRVGHDGSLSPSQKLNKALAEC
ncbi:hypothetical protein GUJ93_ZPchr0001g31200 [Zizania palustris]|uniref:BED-type domain-containing protein n=1 Tax=Zizania palustris TaxID=103762 RepID=A0A8J5RRV5_ZIZPA|nr:hypothetical protein GUJ93_ZPchr0001g31200 [Zizania palustris]